MEEIKAAEETIFHLVNRERAGAGRKPLVWDSRAGKVAREHSRLMATQWFFSHMDRNGNYTGDRLRAAGISWRWVGENIYSHHDREDTATSSVQGWMRSAGHRENILSTNFTHTGIGVETAADGTVYCTQVFFRPAN